MGQRNVLSILCFVLLSFGEVSAQICSANGFFRPNSTYDTNRRLVLSFLPSNVTAQGGFYNASVGQEPNRVYASGMCIPGAQAKDCSDCIRAGSDQILRSCPNQTEAFSWPGDPTLCLVHYSNRSFFGSLDLEPSLKVYNTGDLTGNLTDFDRIWSDLALRMIAAASSGENNMSSSKPNYYAAETAELSDFQTIYALMQCTPDLSPGDCNTCLRQSVGDYMACCSGKQGGVVARSSCFFRWDLYPFSGAFDDIRLEPPAPPLTPSPGIRSNTTTKDSKTISTGTIIAIVVPIVVVFLVFVVIGFGVCWKRKFNKETEVATGDEMTTQSLQFDFKTIEAATNKFSDSNKLGGGGFGEVYKATLTNGTEVAVKRLSKTSGQGIQEFKNEVVLVAKLQHRNLVRLLGFCVEGEERILVYEFVLNKSLDYFLFDPLKKSQLDWTRRNKIIGGIARGMLYLHQDSRLTVIHRDLKASNILLDGDMNPKVADFGTARIFGMDQTRANTSRIVGTYGYMPPEYAMHGQFSAKSDVYSFGVLVLEIISGKINSSFYQTEGSVGNLVTHAWRLWRNGSPLELVDPAIGENYESNEVIRCIHIALLCVQENIENRPTLSTTTGMLTSNSITLPVPRKPGFFFQRRRDQEASGPYSIDDASITDLNPR